MRRPGTFTLGLAFAVGLFLALPASAKVVVLYFTGGASDGIGTHPHNDVFSPTDPLGTLPATFLYETASKCAHVANGCTYDFVFKLSGIAPGDYSTVEVSAQAYKVVAEPISFDLFSGVPAPVKSLALVSNPNFVGHSNNSPPNSSPTSPVIAASLGNGSYYVQIAPSQIAVSGEASSGSFVETVVPEPFAWTLMLIGFAGVGAALRGRPTPITTSPLLSVE